MKTEEFLARLQESGALPSRREAERRAKAATMPGVAKRREEAYAEAGA